MKKLTYLIIAIAVLTLIVVGCIPVVPPAEQNETSGLMKWNSPDLFVDDDYTSGTPGWGSTHFATIGEAITAASGGNTIEVAEGTYTETVTVNKSVTLLGANYDVDPAGGLDRGGESVIVGQVEFTSTGDGATLNGFKLNGNRVYVNGASSVMVSYNIVVNSSMHGIRLNPSSPNTQILYNTISNPNYDGICNYMGNSGVIISHNHITGVTDQPPIVSGMHIGTGIEITYNVISGCTGNKGIDYWGGPGANISYNEISDTDWEGIFTDTTATIQNNIIDNCLKEGIVLYSGAINSTVSENTISNCLKGIVLYSSNSTVSGNTISNTTYEGIQAYASATIIGNEISGCYKGIQIGASASGSTISGNTISSTTYEGIQTWAPATITGNDISGCYHGIQIQNHATGTIIEWNNIHDNTHHGIEIPNYAGPQPEVTGVTITNNIFTNNGYTGIKVGGGTDGSGININYNGFEGNGIFGVESGVKTEGLFVDATRNWWGHASGPGGEYGRVNKQGKIIGKGDAVSNYVNWEPWLSQPTVPPTQILNKWDLEGTFVAHLGYNWGGLAEGSTWEYSIHIKEAMNGDFSVGSIYFTTGDIEVTGIVEQTKSDYAYWAESNLAAAGRAEYDGITYNFLFLYSERATWFALSEEDLEPSWSQETAWGARDYELHSLVPDETFIMDPKRIH